MSLHVKRRAHVACNFNCLIGTEGLSKVTAPRRIVVTVIMVALCNRADHYIFALWFLSIYLLLFSSPNLSGHRLDVYHTSTHGVALVRI